MTSIFILQASLNDFKRLNQLDLAPFFAKEIRDKSATFSSERRTQYLLSRFLLRELLIKHDFLTENQRLPDIHSVQNQRPQFKNAGYPDFNITHSGDQIAVGISTKGQLGLDLEIKRERPSSLAVAKQFFSLSELDWLKKQTDQLAGFWQLWTLRESALKLYAKGVWQMKQISIKMPEIQIEASFGDSFYPQIKIENLLFLSLCSDQPIKKLQIEWF